MIRRLTVPLLALAVLSTGCSTNLGRAEPACGEDVITNAIILAAQSVPGTEYVPCFSDLKPGWSYEHLESRSGHSRFWISSDRVGSRFLEVSLEGSCDISGAVPARSDDPEIELLVEGVVEDFYLDVVIVPEGADQSLREHGARVALDIGSTRVRDRLIHASVDLSDAPTAERIRLALAEGNAVLVIGERENEEETVELHVKNPGAEVVVTPGMELDEALDEAAERLGPPVYQATWYHPFENGCVTYRFDASGIGVERIASDVATSLGFAPIGPIREYGEQVGYVLP